MEKEPNFDTMNERITELAHKLSKPVEDALDASENDEDDFVILMAVIKCAAAYTLAHLDGNKDAAKELWARAGSGMIDSFSKPESNEVH